MAARKKLPRRKVIRVKEHNYDDGMFSITQNVEGRQRSLGRLVGEQIELSPRGEIVDRVLNILPQRFLGVYIDTYMIMPDHMHILLAIDKDSRIAQLPDGEELTLFEIMRQFKAITARLIHRDIEGGIKEFAWQDRFNDRIIRGEREIQRKRKYILENPLRLAHRLEPPDI